MAKFKAGDRVKIVDSVNRHGYEIGSVVTLGEPQAYLERDGWGSGYDTPSAYLWDIEIELATPEPSETIQPTDPVNPEHYSRYAIQPIEFILRNNLPFDIGNVIKYALRYDEKDGIQDLEKAIRNLQFRIALLKGEPVVAG